MLLQRRRSAARQHSRRTLNPPLGLCLRRCHHIVVLKDLRKTARLHNNSMLARLLSTSQTKQNTDSDLFYDEYSDHEYDERVSAEVLTYASHFGIDLSHTGCRLYLFMSKVCMN